jgi:rhodanese-related sulfurtransferase
VNFLLENYNWALILVALISGGLLAWPLVGRLGNGLSPTDAVTLINREKAVLVDVSDAEAYAKGHAAGAKNAPLAQLETSSALPKKKNVPLIVLCPTGSRASKAVAVLKKLGYENCRPLTGGTAAWRQAGLPIDKKPDSSQPA